MLSRLLLLITLAFPLVVSAALNDSGQALCYGANGQMFACSEDQTALPGQDGVFGRDAQARRGNLVRFGGGEAGFDFVPLDLSGVPIALDASGKPQVPHACVQDAVTGLVWFVADNPTTPSTDIQAEAQLQTARRDGVCGFGDWRLPSIPELVSVAHFGSADEGVDPGFFPDVRQGRYRSRDRMPDDASLVRVFSYQGSREGLKSFAVPADSPLWLRIVRGEPRLAALHVRPGGMVADQLTGLVWDQCVFGRYGKQCAKGHAIHQDWPAALRSLARLNAARYKGHDDWRMPNVKELYSIVDQARIRPAVDSRVFPATEADWYWTSTTRVALTGQVHTVDFSVGQVRFDNKPESHYLRLVRGGH